MKKLLSIGLIVITTLLISCKKENQQLDCSLYLCAWPIPPINLKFVDKNTNTDLLFDPATSYSITDIKITRPNSEFFVPFISIDSTNKIVSVSNIHSGDMLQIGNLPADKIIIETRVTTRKICCPPVEVIKLMIGDRIVCQPCRDLDERIITVEK